MLDAKLKHDSTLCISDISRMTHIRLPLSSCVHLKDQEACE